VRWVTDHLRRSAAADLFLRDGAPPAVGSNFRQPVLAALPGHRETATFRACHCRDYARVDIRIDAAGNPYVLEINSMAALGGGASYVLAAEIAGYSFNMLVNRILDVAHQRCFGISLVAAEDAPAGRHLLAATG
jgi:D-alanine-D-alanine ligase